MFSILGTQARSLSEILFEGKSDPTSITVFVLVSTLISVSIIGIVYLVKKKTGQPAAQVAVSQVPDLAVELIEPNSLQSIGTQT